MSFDLFLYVGGYWSKNDGFYHGGETHEVGLMSAATFSINSVVTLVVELIGYEENMRKVSWFPPESPENREDIDSEDVLKKVVHYAVGAGALTLYVVREDDPYLGRRVDSNLGYLADEDNEGELPIGDEGGNPQDENEEQNGDSSSESDGGHAAVDESKYPKFSIGDEYNTIQSFKNAVNKYASSSQPPPERTEPMHDDTGPRTLPREGYGVFTSPVTGDDYIHVGRSVVDTRDNTVLPSTLYAARERKKLAVGRGRGKKK